MQWTYKADVGELSEILEMEDQFVIAALSQISKEGYKPVTQVSNEIKSKLINDKKAELIIAEIDEQKAGSQTLSSLAQKMEESIKSAENINFQSYQVTGAGAEPALVGAIAYATKETISQPVKGVSGVYVFRVTSSVADAAAPSAKDLAQTMSNSYGYRINYQAFTALRENADIVDDRYLFY